MGIEPVCADWHSFGDTELNHLAIWTLYIGCFDRNMFNLNLITKLNFKKKT